jgi:hypothetical protein
MTSAARLSFAHRSLAVLGAAMATATAMALIFAATLAIEHPQLLRQRFAVVMLPVIWLSVLMIVLPLGAVVLSLLWPLTRRMTPAADAICALAGIATALLLTPALLPAGETMGWKMFALLTMLGFTAGGFYIVIARQLCRDRTVLGPAADRPAAPDQHSTTLTARPPSDVSL